MSKQPRSAKERTGIWKPVFLIIMVIAAMIMAHIFRVGDRLGALKGWIQARGAMGPFIYVLIYSVAAVAALPGSVLTAFAGVIFGPVIGAVTVSIGATLGATMAFMVSRYFARKAVHDSMKNKPAFQKLERMTSNQGPLIVLLTRIVPVFPFNLLNYGFGLTGIPLGTYVLWSWIGMLPGTILYTAGGDALAGAAAGKIPWTTIIIIAAVLVILVPLGKAAKKKLDAADGMKKNREFEND